MLGVASLGLTSCGDVADEITSIVYGRYFSPTDLTAKVRNRTNIEVSWTAVDNVDQYVVEVYQGSDETGTLVKTETVTENSYTVTGLEGETTYYVRVKATGESNNDSKWSGATATTDTEQIAKEVKDEELTAKSVVIRWTAGETVQTITLTPGDITHAVTDEEVKAGAATIEGLTPETEYTAVLTNNGKTRGSVSFKTLIDFGDATPLYADDDIVSALTNANDGDEFIIVDPVEVDLGKFTLTKSISISGFKPSERPTIKGSFEVSSAVASVTLKNLIIDAKGANEDGSNASQLLNVGASAANLSKLSISGCLIKNTAKNLIYNNAAGTLGDIVIDDCVIDSCALTGGDFFDLRGGSLNSLTVTNTTIMNSCRTMLRGQVKSDYTFKNCTFYNVCQSDEKDNNGMFRSTKSGSTLTLENLLLVKVGPESATSNAKSGAWATSEKNYVATESSVKGIYYYDSPQLWTVIHKSDYTSFAKDLGDPKFADAANGDLTVGNDDLKDIKAGDPRWY